MSSLPCLMRHDFLPFQRPRYDARTASKGFNKQKWITVIKMCTELLPICIMVKARCFPCDKVVFQINTNGQYRVNNLTCIWVWILPCSSHTRAVCSATIVSWSSNFMQKIRTWRWCFHWRKAKKQEKNGRLVSGSWKLIERFFCDLEDTVHLNSFFSAWLEFWRERNVTLRRVVLDFAQRFRTVHWTRTAKYKH